MTESADSPTAPFSSTEKSWALYDWANSAFATSVMAGFFPVFFKSFLASDLSAEASTLRLGLATSAVMLLVLLALPLATAIADRRQWGVPALLIATVIGALATAAIALLQGGAWLAGAMLYGVATAAFSVALVFYDALLPKLANGVRAAKLSTLGYSLGYLGGGLLLGLQVAALLLAPKLGLNSAQVVQWSFVSVALWWLAFTLPLWRDRSNFRSAPRENFDSCKPQARASIFSDLKDTTLTLWRSPKARYFLLAYFLYMDGVQTIIKMAVDYGLALGLSSNDLISALLLTQFVGVPSSILFFRLSKKISLIPAIALGIVLYLGVTIWAGLLQSAWEFYVLALLIGVAQGGVQALSRSYFSDLVDPSRANQSFLFYSVLSKASAIMGPALMGIAAQLSSSSRAGIIPIGVLFLGGLLLLMKIPKENTSADPVL